MLQGFSAKAEKLDGTANNLVTKEMSLMLKSHVKTLINKQTIHIATLININLDNTFLCKKKLLSPSNKLPCNGLIISRGFLSFSNKVSISNQTAYHRGERNVLRYQCL